MRFVNGTGLSFCRQPVPEATILQAFPGAAVLHRCGMSIVLAYPYSSSVAVFASKPGAYFRYGTDYPQAAKPISVRSSSHILGTEILMRRGPVTEHVSDGIQIPKAMAACRHDKMAFPVFIPIVQHDGL